MEHILKHTRINNTLESRAYHLNKVTARYKYCPAKCTETLERWNNVIGKNLPAEPETSPFRKFMEPRVLNVL